MKIEHFYTYFYGKYVPFLDHFQLFSSGTEEAI